MTTGADVLPPLCALLGGAVDYAGLFPPAALALEPALDNYATYVRSSDSWMLGCFVLPIAKLSEAGQLLKGRFDAEYPLRISAIGAKAASADTFPDGLRASLGELARFELAHDRNVQVCQYEAPLPSGVGDPVRSLLRRASELVENIVPWPLQVFWEIPFCEYLPDILRRFIQHNEEVDRAHRSRPFGIKLRTGGTEAVAFPSSAQLAAALVAARDADVALKFTAGLHHPFRRFDAGVAARMHGFVNVFTAGVLLHQRRIDATQAHTILEDENPAGFVFDADGLSWHGRRMVTAALSGARRFVTSFGSCSFDEPCDDLRAAKLLL